MLTKQEILTQDEEMDFNRFAFYRMFGRPSGTGSGSADTGEGGFQ